MAESEEEESWEEFFETNRLVPIHPNRCISQQSQPDISFCLTLKSIEGVVLPKILEEKPIDAIEFQMRITFYDTANKYFYGSTWLGPVLTPSSVDNKVFKVDCDEFLYFHSSLNDYTCLAAIEVIVFEENQGYNCGWSILRMFNQTQQLKDSTSTPIFSRLRFYYGSVQALLYIPEEIEKCSLLQPIEGFYLNYTLTKHSALEKVLHLIPENALLSGDDIVPGILDTHQDDSGIIDILRKPRLAKTMSCFLNKLSITLDPSIEEFEEQLLADLNHDRQMKNNISPDDGLNVKIIERRLKVCVHNGWTFVSDAHIVFLEEEYEGSKTGRKSPSSTSSVKGKVVSLAPRSRLELKEMVQHHWFAIVFQIDYIVSEPYTQPLIETKKKKPSLTGSLMRSQNQTITVCWAVWTPFERSQSVNEAETVIQLQSGATLFPSNTLVYADARRKSTRCGTIRFSFTQQKKRFSSRGSAVGSLERLSKLHVPSTQVPSSTQASHSTLGEAMTETVNHTAPLTPGVSGRPPLPGRTPRGPELTTEPRPAAPTPMGDLNEVTFASQGSSPVVLLGTGTRMSTIPRAAYARLATAGFQSITDRHGNPPLALDPAEVVRFDLDLEEGDKHQCNEIIIQFLAMTGCLHRSVFFTFQFYRFPQFTTERMCLKSPQEGDKTVVPLVLVKYTKNGSLCNDQPGLMIRFMVDPAFMQQGENRIFSRYLLAQNLHVDVWDGDSLILIGSFAVELKHLLRQGREAVLVNHELDVFSSELSEDTVAITGAIARTGSAGPLGVKSSVVARVHLRIANIGHFSETPKTKIGTIPRKPTKVVMSLTVSGAPMSSNAGFHQSTKSKAKQLAERDSELAAVLFSRREQFPKEMKNGARQVDAIRKRKLERMQAIRQTQGIQTAISSVIIQKEEKIQRARDLKTIQLYRKRSKHEGILASLHENISSTHTIYPSFGTAEYFEFVIRNPYSTEQTISVHCEDKELRVVTDAREWRHLKMIAGTTSPIEENMFHKSEDSPYQQIFLRSREAVHIPFRFQTFRTDDSVPAQGPAHPLNQSKAVQSFEVTDENKGQSRTIKVSFNLKDERPVAILNLIVEPRPHAIDFTQRLYHPEQSFLKKTIRLPPWHTLPGAPIVDDRPPQLFVRCSDPNVICESRKAEAGGEPTEVFLKVACGPSPTIKRFFLLLYIDAHMASPCQIWQFYVHSLQRVDISAVEGQSSRTSVILRGTQSSRLVKCYSSHPDELTVSPTDPFMLMANAVHELHLALSPLLSGALRYMYVNVVDTEFHQLIRTWLVCATCQQPTISKAFEIQLQVGGGKGSNKRVSYKNPYPTRKIFHLKSNRPDLLQFKESAFEIGSGESHNIGLRFIPQQTQFVAQILIFINDSEDKNEETFCVNAVYR